ncbi:unnamed protein product [Darwinula stevensoni]|uniref:ABC-2 type transporter domain-containing protein n=1 Tax=Darwinula stevensoni TaxID=69355 RepID=A0A7R9A9A8_9CRUS|nr:unnamed protein product [Darwinula stevensoni]CAG0897224.1 unnamed protein product [Darwinula stevensoni]
MCWPREAMITPLYYISGILPQTYGTDALRNIMSRGLGMENFSVWMGCVAPTVWTVLQLLATALINRYNDGVL